MFLRGRTAAAMAHTQAIGTGGYGDPWQPARPQRPAAGRGTHRRQSLTEVPHVSALELHTPSVTPSSNLGRIRVIDQRRRPNVRRSRRRLAHPFRAALVYTSLPAF